jgi:kynurenine formamidase
MDRLTPIWLSHPLSVETPAYGGGHGLKIQSASSIANGDTANTGCWTFSNHLGTHIDAPLHFFDGGMAISDYSPNFWVFHNAQLMDIPCEDGRLICSTDLPEPAVLENRITEGYLFIAYSIDAVFLYTRAEKPIPTRNDLAKVEMLMAQK